LHVFVQGVVYRAGGDFLVGQLSLVLGDDLECVENTGESGLGSNALDWVLVEEVVDPGNLGDLCREVLAHPLDSDRASFGTGAK
jgi:hypothetical protein